MRRSRSPARDERGSYFGQPCQRELRRCRLRLEAAALVLEAAVTTRVLTRELVVRALPDALSLVEQKPPQVRWFVVPFTAPAATPLLEELRARGVRVSVEPQIVPAAVALTLRVLAVRRGFSLVGGSNAVK